MTDDILRRIIDFWRMSIFGTVIAKLYRYRAWETENIKKNQLMLNTLQMKTPKARHGVRFRIAFYL